MKSSAPAETVLATTPKSPAIQVERMLDLICSMVGPGVDMVGLAEEGWGPGDDRRLKRSRTRRAVVDQALLSYLDFEVTVTGIWSVPRCPLTGSQTARAMKSPPFGRSICCSTRSVRGGSPGARAKRTRSSVWPMRSPFESSAMAAKTRVAREAPSTCAGERPAVESE